jgi:hypothetical protein
MVRAGPRRDGLVFARATKGPVVFLAVASNAEGAEYGGG